MHVQFYVIANSIGWSCKRIDHREGEDHAKLDNTTVPANEETARTNSGRTIKPPERLIQEIGAIAVAGATAAAN
jgi:hypothetical protein